MIDVDVLYKTLFSEGVNFFTGVPDSLLKDICAYITDYTPKNKNIIAANEGAAIAIAAGHYLASATLPLVYMQNSGLGNAINPLLSLADDKVYGIPMLLMIGWRGEPGIQDEPQHIKQGEVTLALLEAMKIPFVILSFDENDAIEQIHLIIKEAREKSKPSAIIIRKGIFKEYKLRHKIQNDYLMSREFALKRVIDFLEDDIVISTTGKLSRELFEYRETCGIGHEMDLLTVGSMGHASSIALGIALEKTDRQVFCLDGDGAFIMHMGTLGSIGSMIPTNYKHILFNNGVHESVGGQPTCSFDMDIPAIAKACGYRNVLVAANENEILQSMQQLRVMEGPALLEVRVNLLSRKNLGRPTIAPIENKKSFMNFLR